MANTSRLAFAEGGRAQTRSRLWSARSFVASVRETPTQNGAAPWLLQARTAVARQEATGAGRRAHAPHSRPSLNLKHCQFCQIRQDANKVFMTEDLRGKDMQVRIVL